MDIGRLTQKVSVNDSAHWSTRLHVETSRTSRCIPMCSCVGAALLRLYKVLWVPEPRWTIHRYRHMYGNQDEWEESRVHDQWGYRALFTLNSTNVQVGVWAATGGGESPTGLFKQRVDELANSFTKMTQSLPVFPWLRVAWVEFLQALTGKIQFYLCKRA